MGKGNESSEYFVFEVCEYCCYFLSYQFDYVIMMNIDFDYFDYFVNIDDVFDVF